MANIDNATFLRLWQKNKDNLERLNGRYDQVISVGSMPATRPRRIKPGEADELRRVWFQTATNLYWKLGKPINGRKANDYVINQFIAAVMAEWTYQIRLGMNLMTSYQRPCKYGAKVGLFRRTEDLCLWREIVTDTYLPASQALLFRYSMDRLVKAINVFSWAAVAIENETEMLMNSLHPWARGVFVGWDALTGSVKEFMKLAIYGAVGFGAYLVYGEARRRRG